MKEKKKQTHSLISPSSSCVVVICLLTFLVPFSLQNIENVMCHHFAKTGSGLSLTTTSLIKSFEPTKGVAFVLFCTQALHPRAWTWTPPETTYATFKLKMILFQYNYNSIIILKGHYGSSLLYIIEPHTQRLNSNVKNAIYIYIYIYIYMQRAMYITV